MLVGNLLFVLPDRKYMAQPRHPEDVLHREIVRLRQELEQVHADLDDARSEIAALALERDGLRRAATARLEAPARVGRTAERARKHGITARDAVIHVRQAGGPETAERHVLLEETAILSADLRQASEVPNKSNQALDRRVAERTAVLDGANAELAALNAALLQRVEAESAARAAAQTELFKLQKLEAVGQLTGGIAHDFNNLLTVIISGLQLLGQVTEENHRARVLRRTEEAAWRGAHLTQRLLAFARRQALSPERLDLMRHVDGICDLLTHGLRENIQVRIEIDPGVWPVEVDVAALELSLLNLAVNARDAMPQGGRFVVSAHNVAADRRDGRRVCRRGRRLRGDQRRRHRHRHVQGTAGQGVRALLHHQDRRQGDRARPGAGVWLREAVRWRRLGGERAEPGHRGAAAVAAQHAPATRSGPRKRSRPSRLSGATS